MILDRQILLKSPPLNLLAGSAPVTTNVKQSQLHFCTKQITAILWSLTRAAVKLLLFQDNDLPFHSSPIQPVITIKITDATQGEMSDRSS